MPRGLFSPDGKLARRWPLWASATVLIYFTLVAFFIAMLSGVGRSWPWSILLGGLWVLSCAASCFGFMSLFARFATHRIALFDSLTDNAYGMLPDSLCFRQLASARAAENRHAGPVQGRAGVRWNRRAELGHDRCTSPYPGGRAGNLIIHIRVPSPP